LIPRADLAELEKVEWEEMRAAPQAVAPVHCRVCQAIIPDQPNAPTSTSTTTPPATAAICQACAAKYHLDPNSPGRDGRGDPAAGLEASIHSALRAFTIAIRQLLDEINHVLQQDEHSIEFQLRATAIWKHVAELRRCLEHSPEHGELLDALQHLACAELTEPFSHHKARALRDALDVLEQHAVLAGATNERVADILRAGGFHLDSPFVG
jgi:hypothetical protein